MSQFILHEESIFRGNVVCEMTQCFDKTLNDLSLCIYIFIMQTETFFCHKNGYTRHCSRLIEDALTIILFLLFNIFFFNFPCELVPCNSKMAKPQFYCLSALQRAKTISLLPYNTMKVYSTLMGGQTQEMYSFEEIDEERVKNMRKEVL